MGGRPCGRWLDGRRGREGAVGGGGPGVLARRRLGWGEVRSWQHEAFEKPYRLLVGALMDLRSGARNGAYRSGFTYRNSARCTGTVDCCHTGTLWYRYDEGRRHTGSRRVL